MINYYCYYCDFDYYSDCYTVETWADSQNILALERVVKLFWNRLEEKKCID